MNKKVRVPKRIKYPAVNKQCFLYTAFMIKFIPQLILKIKVMPSETLFEKFSFGNGNTEKQKKTSSHQRRQSGGKKCNKSLLSTVTCAPPLPDKIERGFYKKLKKRRRRKIIIKIYNISKGVNSNRNLISQKTFFDWYYQWGYTGHKLFTKN